MFEEADCNCAGKVTLTEELTQQKYENKRIKEELDSLRKNSFGIEEHLNSLSLEIEKKDSDLKRSAQKVTDLLQLIEEKDGSIDVLLQSMDEVKKANKMLEVSLIEVKIEKDELVEQNEMLFIRERESIEKCNTVEMKLSELQREFYSLSESLASYRALVENLKLQIEVLEDEKASLQSRIFNDRCGISPFPNSPTSPFNASSESTFNVQRVQNAQRCLDFSFHENDNLFDIGLIQLSLKEELLMAKEKRLPIEYVKEWQGDGEETMEQLGRLLQERLREATDLILHLWNDSDWDFKLFPLLKSNFEKLIGAYRKWSDGQGGEINPLAEAPDTVKATEIIINAQPVPNRTIESVSIATQTDRILLARAFDDFGPIHNVLDHKYNDVDMDLYRSYRKLSILPEEEDDETFKRIPSLKNTINSKPISAKLPETYKTHSADDILNFEKRVVKLPPSEKLISSCTDIIFSGPENVSNGHIQQTEFFEGSLNRGEDFPTICDNKLSDSSNFKSEQNSKNNSNKTLLEPLDPLQALRQPHSFDSYLDPQQIPVIPLPRQISDPIQNIAFDPPLTRRGSYLKRPRSTCRPLRLPCEENAIKREERVSKVRFDLSNNVNCKSNDNTNGSKGPMPVSNLKNHRKIERISRFTVERIDEDEFRKSIDESNKMTNRKRPPLIHSVVYKKSVLQDITFYPDNSVNSADEFTSKVNTTGSPDSPYETATENSPGGSFEIANYEGNYLMADVYSTKRRKQSDSSTYSVESQDSVDGNNILVKSIRLHTTGEYITMKELDRESSNSSHLSVDMDIPYIDAEELPVIKPSHEVITRNLIEENDYDLETEDLNERSACLNTNPQENTSAVNQSDSSETFVTACSDMTPVSDVPEMCLSPPKSSGLSKSPTVLKNLSNFELFTTVSESIIGLNQNKRTNASVRNQMVEEEDESVINENSEKLDEDRDEEEEESTVLKHTSSDGSEMSDTVTYVTGKSDPSNILLSSDCDSDTYITIQSDKSALERKYSDFSENSNSPYNTPPDTSSASFCTPPDTYSPILRLTKSLSGEGDSPRIQTRSSSPYRHTEQTSHREYHAYGHELSSNVSPFNSPPCLSPFKRNFHTPSQEIENESVTIYNIDDSNFPAEGNDPRERKESVIFDSPKLEFYETNDSIENLEAFLKTEEGLQELVKTPLGSSRSWKFSTMEDVQEEPAMVEGGELKNSDIEEGFSLKNNSLESPLGMDSKLFEKRGKRHPPLSRQNSTEEYNFLEPHDSCLNLSEEISSPSTTPDTSNKTVVFKSKPLTVSNTIDLEDDDFPISDSEIQINFNGSETEIVEMRVGERVLSNKRMSSWNTEVGEDQNSNEVDEGCNSSYSSTENSTEEHLTIHGNIQAKSAENNSTPKHTSGELSAMVAAQPELDIETLNTDHINEVVSNIDDGIVIGGKTTLSEEEVEKKFQEISLAFRTDMMMLQQRLIIRKRLKDQAERNLVKEIDLMKSKINKLRYLCCDSNSLEELSDLRKHLDIVFASANYLSGSSEAYGFVQNEEKMSGAVSVIIKKIDSLERIQEEMSKSPSLEKPDNKRIQLLSILDDDGHEERMLRRRSVVALAINGPTKRRASIASVPRNSLPSDDSSGSQYSTYSSIAANRKIGTLTKKLSCSQSNSAKPISPLAAVDKTPSRSRKESRIGEDNYGMKLVQDHDNNFISDESYDLLHSSDEEISNDDSDTTNDAALSVLRISGSFGHRMRKNSVASETLNIIDSLRKVVKWNLILVRNSRFQCPENIRQYVPFFITWYVVILVGAIFTSGFFAGFNRCFNSELLYTYLIVSGIITFWISGISMILKFNPLKYALISALMMYVYNLHYTLQEEGIDSVLKRLGVEFEAVYTSGAPI